MNLRTPQHILVIVGLMFLTPLVSRASTYTYSYGSLFDAHTARTVSPELQQIFGPKSGGIKYDARMIHAAEIAAARAHAHSHSACWHAVKNALVDAQVVPTRPTTEYAKEAGDELQGKYGFTKTQISSPFDAPVGAVIVYGGHGAGHVEIRTATGFASDFISDKPSPRPLIGVYIKRS